MKNRLGQTLQGRYQVLEKVGEGGLAAAYTAWDSVIERPVLIKFMDVQAIATSALESFKAALKQLAELTHTNIGSIYDFGEEQAEFFLVMQDRAATETLQRQLVSPIPWSEAIEILLPIIDALEYAHQRQILHTYLNPSNILLSKHGPPRLIDLEQGAVLKLYEHDIDAGIASVPYLAPEVILGERADRRSDIFSLGVILYEMVAGRKPFEADSPMAYALKQIHEPMPRPSLFVRGLPLSVETTMLRAVARDPTERFQSMHNFGDALWNALNSDHVTSSRREEVAREVQGSSAPDDDEWIGGRGLSRATSDDDGTQPPIDNTKETTTSKPAPPTTTETPPEKVRDEVAFTAYHPKEGQVDTWHTLLVYAHVTSALKLVRQDAQKFEREMKPPKETTSKTSAQIARGTEITIVPACDAITFNPDRITFKWAEDFHRAHFRFKADPSLADEAANGQIAIYVGPLIIGILKFAMLFNAVGTSAVADHEEQASMYPRNRIFISYSHKDTDFALMFRNVLEAVGYDVLIDIDDLRAGQVWNDELMHMIEQADIFQLFWSANSSQSEYCRREWEHALKQNKPAGFIRPIYWQRPLPTPPEELSKFHFDYVDLKLPS